MTVIFDPGREAPEGPYVQTQAQGSMQACDSDLDTVDATIRSAITLADTLFHECADGLTTLRDQLRLGETADLKEAVKLASDLRQATQHMLNERNRVDKLRKEVAGGCGGAGALDLDAARDEIGRRLACLRRAGGG